MNKPLIQIADLCKSFATPGGEVRVLRDVAFSINAGERVAVVGASGAGKTTLMHILGGLDRPSSGQVLFEGASLFDSRGPALDAFRNRTIGFVFQFHQLLPEFSALENVMMPLLIGGMKRAAAAEIAVELLQQVGLEHRLSHKPGALSGGEQQRVAIARALVRKPRLLLADEPTGNLDSRTADGIYQLLDSMHERHGLTMIVVTHSMALAGKLDRVIELEDGALANDSLN